MAFCAWCGNQVPQVSYAACPRCGNPTNGSQRVAGAAGGASTAGIIIVIVVGGFVLIGVIGILAAIAIPNFLTAKNRAQQKRTMTDMRLVATVVESYATDENSYPEGSSVSSITPKLVPKYLKSVPTVDAWGTPFRYECWPAGECKNYAIASAGADKTFEHDSLQEYGNDTKTTDFDSDIVFYDGNFAQYPEGVQTR